MTKKAAGTTVYCATTSAKDGMATKGKQPAQHATGLEAWQLLAPENNQAEDRTACCWCLNGTPSGVGALPQLQGVSKVPVQHRYGIQPAPRLLLQRQPEMVNRHAEEPQ